ncbi:unnamed protein product [Adineta steineri]|uniref:NAD(P)(+)--arginine ADP-ribosyltransferase n=2 Tax=Adineta steineri TaxID=433720 RepID=A0A814AC91_9BILA|nr:unnamed protein product [Adineta steineri]
MTSSSNPSQSSTTSPFYYAYRNGLIDVVREELPNMTLDEIDMVQSNGSTALHAASYYGHTEIVKLLLEKGARRSIQNSHKCVPYDEAEKEDIKKLFIRPLNRFSMEDSGHIDWMKCDAAAEQLANDYRFRHKGFGWTPKNIEHRIKHIRDEMSHTDQQRIRTFLNQVQHDPKALLRAYTEDSGHIDWMKCDAAAEQLANDYRFRHKGFGWTPKNIEHRIKHIRDEMSHTDQQRIRTFLNQVQHDPKALLRAYTVESGFYVNLNKDLATRHFDQGTNFGLTYFIDFFYNHPDFDSLAFKGKVYRGMTVTHDDLKEYMVGKKIMNKAFLSTTTDRKTAEEFARNEATNREKQHGDQVKLSALCTFEIINHRTGLNIENLSEYQHEKEVLVGPYTAFFITAVRRLAPNYAEIDLRECETVKQDDDDDDDDDD